MDFNIYTSEMAKSVWDKSFFIDKIPGVKCIVDFGCADGAMIKFLASIHPNITFVGYDINKELMYKAQNEPPFYANVVFFDKTSELLAFVLKEKGFSGSEICINFSSVLHEVYSSGQRPMVDYYIERLKPRYITIRDMYCDESFPIRTDLHDSIMEQLRDQYPNELRAFCAKYGKIDSWKNLTHLLMKLQWVSNGWGIEIEENYYSFEIDKFPQISNYAINFEAHYQLPYLSEKWRKEYDFYNPDAFTHAQFILRRDE